MKQGAIWLVNIDPTLGSEIKKSRPSLVLNVDELGRLPLRIIAPITDWKAQYANYPWMVEIAPMSSNFLRKRSAIDCFQIRSVSVQRLSVKIGTADTATVAAAIKATALVFGIDR